MSAGGVCHYCHKSNCICPDRPSAREDKPMTELTDEVLMELERLHGQCSLALWAAEEHHMLEQHLPALIAAAKRCQWYERIIETHCVMPCHELGNMLNMMVQK